MNLTVFLSAITDMLIRLHDACECVYVCFVCIAYVCDIERSQVQELFVRG